jgi:hypothetical protein
MQVDAALLKEQGVEFAVVSVKEQVLQHKQRADETVADCQGLFGLPTVLMGQTAHGRVEFYGRKDIANFLADVPIESLPWKRYTVS